MLNPRGQSFDPGMYAGYGQLGGIGAWETAALGGAGVALWGLMKWRPMWIMAGVGIVAVSMNRIWQGGTKLTVSR